LDHLHVIAKNATAHKLNSYYTLAISYCTFCVGKHTILGPVSNDILFRQTDSADSTSVTDGQRYRQFYG